MDKKTKDRIVIEGGVVIVVILISIAVIIYTKRHINKRPWEYLSTQEFQNIHKKIKSDKNEISLLLYPPFVSPGELKVIAKTKDKEEFIRVSKEIESFKHPDWVTIEVHLKTNQLNDEKVKPWVE